MRRLRVALLAMPVIALVYLQAALRRSVALRLVLALSVGALLTSTAFTILHPTGTAARPPIVSAPFAPSAFTTVLRTGVGVHDDVSIAFTRPMDPGTAAGALRVTPDVGLHLSWDVDGRTLHVSPVEQWATGTFYTITIGTGATSRDGQRLDAPVRAAFVTRAAAAVVLEAGTPAPGSDPLEPTVTIRSDVPIDLDALRAAIRVTPDVAVVVTPAGPSAEAAATFDVRPAGPLAAGTSYAVSIADGLLDVDGARVAVVAPFVLRTVDAPAVVRFRPAGGSTNVAATTGLSVRFTRPMNHATTSAAFTATDGATAIAFSSTRWAEGGTVLAAVPAKPLRAGATITLRVAGTATSADGIALAAPATSTFVVAAPPKPKPKPASRPAPTTTRTSGGSSGSGGSSTGTATWYAVEKYYLGLMNCTRTGGWVTSTGSCSSPGGRNVAPLALSAGISSKVSRPYAKYLAVHNACDHFLDGSPGDRLRRAGYTSYKWAENIGCRSGDPYAAVLGSHLYFQAEKSYNGGHYVNLMNALYDRCGIGVWVYAGRVRLVVDFYHP